MTWYVDTSAFLKLARAEAETEALRGWIADHDVASSDLLRTEARRAAAHDAVASALIEQLLGTMTLARLSSGVFDQAGLLRVPTPLRSLDAIHIVAARQLRSDLQGIVTYDGRMTTAAASLGIATVAPAS